MPVFLSAYHHAPSPKVLETRYSTLKVFFCFTYVLASHHEGKIAMTAFLCIHLFAPAYLGITYIRPPHSFLFLIIFHLPPSYTPSFHHF